MSTITLEAIQTKHIAGRTIELNQGERYAEIVLDADGNYIHDLVLLPPRYGKRLNWKDAMEWAEEVGSALPTRQEQALILANCKPYIEGEYHWSCEEYAEDASCAWVRDFDYGYQLFSLKINEHAAVAVRRVRITEYKGEMK
jgi:hypothetical protein